MAKSDPVRMLVTYLPKKGKEQELQALVAKHAAVLRSTGLCSPEPVRSYTAHDKRGHGDEGVFFVETFEWRDADAPGIAHQTPEIMSVWEPMGVVMEELKLTVLEPLATA